MLRKPTTSPCSSHRLLSWGRSSQPTGLRPLRSAPSRYPNPLACWWVGEPAVCNLKGGVAVPAHHTDFWNLTGEQARTHNGMYFPKYIILIAMLFVFISALQGGVPVFQVHWHSPSL